MNELNSIAIMYGITPCHAGSGSSMGIVDLPIQRERHTNWPVIQSSGVKGAFRANFEKYRNAISETQKHEIHQLEKLTDSIFGCDNGDENNGGFAGSLSISDAKILAYPMRSNVAPFVWMVSPTVLKRFIKDLIFTGKLQEVDSREIFNLQIEKDKYVCINGDIQGPLILEDYELSKGELPGIEKIKAILEQYLKEAERLVIVPDEVFNYGVTDCTQIMTQIRIDSTTGTTKDGSLRYQEELPSDTIMYAVILWGDSKNKLESKLKAETIKSFVCDTVIKKYIQIAGDETCGRGIFELSWK